MKNERYNVTSVYPQILTLKPLSTGLRVYFTGTEAECKSHACSAAFVKQTTASPYKGCAYRISKVSEYPEIELDR